MTWGEEIVAMIREVEEAQAEEMTECPLCGWSLERLENGDLHCKYCGWISGIGRNQNERIRGR